MKTLSKIIFIMIMSTTALSASDKMYLDEKELCFEQDAFYYHIGGNEWINMPTVHKDKTGLFTYESTISRTLKNQSEYEKQWKCPYCHRMWPETSPCKNTKCPSRNK